MHSGDDHISSAEEARETPPELRPLPTVWNKCSVCDLMFETTDKTRDACDACVGGTYEDPNRPEPPPHVLRPSRRRHDAGGPTVAVEEVPESLMFDKEATLAVSLDSSPELEKVQEMKPPEPKFLSRACSAMDPTPEAGSEAGRLPRRSSAPGWLEGTGGSAAVVEPAVASGLEDSPPTTESSKSEYRSSTPSSTTRSSSIELPSSGAEANEKDDEMGEDKQAELGCGPNCLPGF